MQAIKHDKQDFMQDYNSALEKSIRQLARKCHAIFM